MASIEAPVFNSPNFRWQDPYIYIDITDCYITEEAPEDTETSVSLFAGNPTCDKASKHWRSRLGEILATDFLAVNLGTQTRKKYQLAQFPDNYLFYVRKTTKPGKKPRHDAYLQGAGHTWRSPMEFVLHAAWLIDGKLRNGCKCINCNPRVNGQKEINKELEENRRQISERIMQARVTGTTISREPNAMNRKGFIKSTRPRERRPKRASLEFHYGSEGGASTSSSTGGGNYIRLNHGYDESDKMKE